MFDWREDKFAVLLLNPTDGGIEVCSHMYSYSLIHPTRTLTAHLVGNAKSYHSRPSTSHLAMVCDAVVGVGTLEEEDLAVRDGGAWPPH